MRSLFGERIKLKLVQGERSWLRRRLGLSRATSSSIGWTGPSLADDVLSAVEARALWARLGF
jgi:hypothetical protein